MKGFFQIFLSWLVVVYFVWIFYEYFFRVKFNLVELNYLEIMLIHFVFRYFFLWTKPTRFNSGNFEKLPMKDFFNKISKR